ncbi:MAG TPA: PAS domain-containing protein [Candidatus Nanopelagicales bacterium]|nr:PAS domain-containing protein [Candidatus Nanopelagicales bacterium]
MDPDAQASIAELRAENAALRAQIAEQRARADETSGSFDLGALVASVESSNNEAAMPGGALRQSRLLLIALLENSPSAIFVKDVHGRYVLVNQQLTSILGVTDEQVLGLTDADLFAAESAEYLQRADNEAMAAGRPLQYEETVPTPQGPREFLTVKFPLRATGGQVLGLCGISTDITDQKRAGEARMALQEQMIQVQRAALRELSSPLMPIAAGVLAMPLIGTIDSVRAKEILEALLEGIARQQARTAILDITGVRVVDTQVANALVESARAARLLGAEVLLTGVSPAIAQTLVGLNLDLSDVTTLGTLQAGIAYALRGPRAGRR